MKTTQQRPRLVGFAGGSSDGHKRITQTEGAVIHGGSEATHARMQEALIKTAEQLKRKGKTVETADSRELGDMLRNNTPR